MFNWIKVKIESLRNILTGIYLQTRKCLYVYAYNSNPYLSIHNFNWLLVILQ